MSGIRVRDVAFVRFSAPDLAAMAVFLDDFGMRPAGETGAGRLFMRGHGPAPFLHATEAGAPAFLGFGLAAEDLSELAALAEREGRPVEALDAPGGGQVVRLTDPDGFTVEVVAGQRAVEPLDVPVAAPWNRAGGHGRINASRRARRGPSHVMRLGHVVLAVRDVPISEQWYKARFSLITSDEVRPEPTRSVGAFLRLNRGPEPTDHHALFLLSHPGAPRFEHAAFEVQDLEDLMVGHAHLGERGRTHRWGVGRHLLGSQVFDYWTDPWGHEVEHWTDGDRLDAGQPSGVAGLDDLMGVQWGPGFPGAAGRSSEPGGR